MFPDFAEVLALWLSWGHCRGSSVCFGELTPQLCELHVSILFYVASCVEVFAWLPSDGALSDAVAFFGRIVRHGAGSLKLIAMALVCGEPTSPVFFVLAAAGIFLLALE